MENSELQKLEIKGDPREFARRLCEPFFETGAETVWVSSCCGRAFAGLEPAKLCRACQKKPTNTPCTSLEHAQDLFAALAS